MSDIIALGEAMVEFNQQDKVLHALGFGGDTSNCAISAKRQGASVGYITKVGKDYFAERLMQLWNQEGIDTSCVLEDDGAPTGIYFVNHDSHGHHYTYYRDRSAASRITPGDLDEEYIAAANILHVSAISQGISESAADTVFKAIELANKNNTLVAYDTNLRLKLWNKSRARAIIHESMSQCQIALPSIDDAQVLTNLDAPEAIVDFYLSLGANVVALKMGVNGVMVATPEARQHVPCINVNTIDCNGAGDTFAGAFLSEINNGKSAFYAAEYGNYAAALSTVSPGAVTAIPNRKDVMDFINKHESLG